jgi:hypothetical protein
VEFTIVTLQRSLDLSKNYQPVQIGSLKIGLQTVKDDVAEIEIQGPNDVTKLSLPVGTSAVAQGYTFICRDVGVGIPEEKKRRFIFFGGKDDGLPDDGLMEAVLDVRWGDQSLHLPQPMENAAHDFMLVRQYDILNDRPLVYNDQDTLVFGKLALQLGPRVEKDSKQYKKPRHAVFRVKLGDGEEEEWQVKLDGDYHRKGPYRLKVTSYDIFNEWYQAVGISIAEGAVKEEIDETKRFITSGIDNSDVSNAAISKTRLDEAKSDPDELVLKVGQTDNLNKVSVKLMELKPGVARVMFLSPNVARTTLEHGDTFEFGDYDVTLVGIHDDRAILRIVKD